MTLTEYLTQEEYNFTHVLVACGNEWPREEYHPIPDVLLPTLRQLWADAYYMYQEMYNMQISIKTKNKRRIWQNEHLKSELGQ